MTLRATDTKTGVQFGIKAVPGSSRDRIAGVLSDTAELLESLVEQSLALMNSGARLDDLIHTVRVPEHLAGRPWLQPVYDDPEFVVRNLWRLYGGWYDGNPSHLQPARETALATELADLAGGASVLADRATTLAAEGDLRLAGHLAEFAALAAPDDTGILAVRRDVNQARLQTERSLMAQGIYRWAVNESADKIEQLGTTNEQDGDR